LAGGASLKADPAANRRGYPLWSRPTTSALNEEPEFSASAKEMCTVNRNRSALTLQHRKEIIDFTIKKRLPGMFVAKEWVTVGGLMSYGENLSDMYHGGAYFVDKILKGAKPADLPVEQVTKFELVLNLNTAKAIGLNFPPPFLATADDLIE